jgi:hypothetical protein
MTHPPFLISPFDDFFLLTYGWGVMFEIIGHLVA